MIKIAHLADIHIRNIERHDEYNIIFKKIYNELTIIKPDRIVIAGDLFESFIEISNEAKIIAGDFLDNLSKITKVIITRGNHDIRKKNINRVDSVKTIIKLIKNKNIFYYDKTGFYQDGNIIWVVYDHIDKNNDPWLNKTKDNSQIYIGIFHDPIYNSSTDVGKVFNDKKYKNIEYFKNNDFMMLGDIHKRQYFRKNKSAAFSGSLIQQDFGENVENHGFLLWEIESSNKFKVKEYNIENEHTFINLYINELTDYDNLNLSANYIGIDTEVKVHWKDYSSNINTINEKKIRDYVKNKFNTNKIKFEKIYIYNDVISSKMLSETLDLSDLEVQTKIFKEYLEEQKYSKKDIKEILKIDEIVNNRLHLSNTNTNIEWSVDKFWFSNFKCYGDDNEINWKDVDGIYQISGENQEGKTTILDALTYILYGKTTTTLSPEKHGDNRYINNKRDLDYCLGGAVIDVDGEKFVVQRKTERKWNKKRTALSSCSTSLDYYNSEDIDDKNKQTGEVKNKTQKKLDAILGDFKDFIRLSFTNSDNLDNILSENRAVFIDNIIRDAGYDVFETKLEEFKEYKKELSEEKLIINIQESEEKISELNTNIDVDNKNIEIKNIEIKELEINLNNLNKDRDNLNKKLNKIDSSISNFDENLNLNSIKNYENKIEESKIQIVILNRDIDNLPSSFNPDELEKLKIKLKEINNKINERKEEISNIKSIINESNNKKDKILSKIKEIKESEIKKLLLKISDNDLKIEKIKNQKENLINDAIVKITSRIQKLEIEKNDLSNNIKLLQKDGLNLKNTNEEIDLKIKKLNDSTACPECGREYDKNDPNFQEHLNHLQEKIKQLKVKKEENKSKLETLLFQYKKLKPIISNIENDISSLLINKENYKKNIFSDEFKEKLKLIGSTKLIKEENLNIKNEIEQIKNDNFENLDTLKENMIKGNSLLKNIENSKNENLKIILNIESELKYFNVEGIEDDIQIEENKKNNYELKLKKISQKENLELSIENFNFKIKELQNEIDKYQESKIKISENELIQESINELDIKILNIKEKITEINQQIINIEKRILISEKEIENISNKIDKYIKQKKTEELLKEYQKCISRDGIPTFLLKKSIHLINTELNEILSNVDFTLFFDENLVLKLSADDRLDVSQNAIESSGKERTFCALALKIALREVNVKSKPKFIFMDELTGKLLNKSVQQFVEFIETLRSKLNKIIIIEHHNYINFDAIINVNKDEKTLVSKLELN